jgi:hypothetical protein
VISAHQAQYTQDGKGRVGKLGTVLVLWAGVAQSVQRLAGRSGDRIPGGVGPGETFDTCPNRPWDSPNLLCNGYGLSFPGGKAAGAWRY